MGAAKPPAKPMKAMASAFCATAITAAKAQIRPSAAKAAPAGRNW